MGEVNETLQFAGFPWFVLGRRPVVSVMRSEFVSRRYQPSRNYCGESRVFVELSMRGPHLLECETVKTYPTVTRLFAT